MDKMDRYKDKDRDRGHEHTEHDVNCNSSYNSNQNDNENSELKRRYKFPDSIPPNILVHSDDQDNNHDFPSPPPLLTPRNKFLDIDDSHRPGLHQPHLSSDSIPIYRGSYAHTSHVSLKSIAQATNTTPIDSVHTTPHSAPGTPQGHTPTLSLDDSGHGTPRNTFVEPKITYLQMKLQKIFGNTFTDDRETYGIEELRNGFFDAIFISPLSTIGIKGNDDDFDNDNVIVIPGELLNKFKYYFHKFFKSCWNHTITIFHNIISKQGIKLVKIFLSYFICYLFCLIIPIANWFGRYNYILPFSSLIHHPGRTVGSQLEISILSIVGLAIGLGWGSLALYIVSSTPRATELYGLIHAISLILCLSIAAWVKAAIVRLHHFLSSLVLAVFFLAVVNAGNINGGIINWDITWDFGIPYLFGIVIPLFINLFIFPDFGHDEVMAMIKCSLKESLDATSSFFSNNDKTSISSDLTKVSLDLSESVREFSNEISLSTVNRKELIEIRNKIQVCIARIRAVPSPASLYLSESNDINGTPTVEATNIIRHSLRKSSNDLIRTISRTLQLIIDYVNYLQTGKVTVQNFTKNYSEILSEQLYKTELSIARLSHAYAHTLRTDSHVLTNSPDQELFDILLHIYYLAEAGKAVLTVGREFHKVSLKSRSWKLSFPSYPLRRALRRSTKQIIHDLGGKSAMYYYWAKEDVDEIFQEIYAIDTSRIDSTINQTPSLRMKGESSTVRYKLWSILHRLQGEETRFAIKTAISIVLISIPAWLEESSQWYNNFDIWLSGMMIFMIVHPTVGGNAQDFLNRTSFCLAGSIWAGISMKARNGNPYVIGVFTAIFMIPCLYRFICTRHPRSGFIGCMSFTLVSLSIYDKRFITLDNHETLFTEIWTRVVACEVGVLVSFLVNWILWPFVARHQVRKSMSNLLIHLSKTYHLVSDRYLYRDKDDEPTELALQLSEICENRVHRSIFAIKELIESVDHEPSLRGTFDKAPYLSMLQSCELIVQDLIAARINSTHFNIYDFDSKTEGITQRLMSFRRDSVASILFVFYLLSGAFRSKDKIPRYLPSSPMARKALFDCMAQLQAESEQTHDYFGTYSITDQGQTSTLPTPIPTTPSATMHHHDEKRMWALVHETAFSKSFTRTAEEIEQLIFYSKQILGEQPF